MSKNYFHQNLEQADPIIAELIDKEAQRLENSIELIASENCVSNSVLECAGSILTNKYAEGYPGRRYYGGCHIVDEVEQLAIDRAKKLFGCDFANVQPHSGSQANQAVFLALLKPGDKILGMDLSAGGHLTHGSKVNISGKWFETHFYTVNEDDHLINYEELEAKAMEVKPKLIIAGASAYSRVIDFKKFREIADKVGAYLMADMAHYSGLIAAGEYPSPVPYADVCTSTTHKTLRGPRSGMIVWNNPDLTKKLNSGIFPGLQGGPLMHIIAAKAVAFKEAMSDEYKEYCQQIIKNMHALIAELQDAGFKIVSGGTDCHVALVDLRPHNVKGNAAENSLESVGITLNKNSIPFDDEKPTITSGIRIGTAAVTTRGFKENECKITGQLITKTLLAHAKGELNDKAIDEINKEVLSLTSKFPIYKK